jgi:multicomponent Na+:H+ antiporter subunit D
MPERQNSKMIHSRLNDRNTMNILLILPILIPMLTAVLVVFFRYSLQTQRWISLIGAGRCFRIRLPADRCLAEWHPGQPDGQLARALWHHSGGRPVRRDDGAAGRDHWAAVAMYSLVSIDRQREAFGYHPLYHFLLMGVCGAFLTGDLFNLYVWFEVMLMASFVLMALGGERGQMEGAIKYVTLNLLSSACSSPPWDCSTRWPAR